MSGVGATARLTDADGGVGGGEAVVLVAVPLLVHDATTSPTSITTATASRFILLRPPPQAVAWFRPRRPAPAATSERRQPATTR
jgi:hypothetical protein